MTHAPAHKQIPVESTVTVIYIAPAFSDQAGQCRIYRSEFCGRPGSVARDYDNNPGHWREAGLMNSSGKLVCFDGTKEQHQDLQDSQPLMAGLYFTYGEDGKCEGDLQSTSGMRSAE